MGCELTESQFCLRANEKREGVLPCTATLYRDGTDGYFADLRNVQFTLSTKF